jgi:hypothetical protein
VRVTHATVSIALDTYSHAIPAIREEAAERIAGLVAEQRLRLTMEEASKGRW